MRQPGERRGHRRRQREVEDRQVAAPRRRIGERPHVAAQLVVDGQGVDLGGVAHRPQQIAHPPGAVADRVSLVRGRHPLVDDHAIQNSELRIRNSDRTRIGSSDLRRCTHSEFRILILISGSALKPTAGTCGSPPAVRRRRTAARSRMPPAARRCAASRGCRRRSRSSVPSKSRPRSRSTAASCPSTIASCSVRIGQDRVHQRGDVARILVVEQHAGAVHRRRHGRRGIGEHRHLLVERFDQRHAEALRARWRTGTDRPARSRRSARRRRHGRRNGRWSGPARRPGASARRSSARTG